LHDQNEYPTRSHLRLHRARRRARRRNLIVATSLLAVVVVAGIAGYLAHRKIQSDRKSAVKNYTITLPEGLTNKQVEEKVAEVTEGNISVREFQAALGVDDYNYRFLSGTGRNLEGFLFPKTYDVTSQTTAHRLINTLLKQFNIETENLEWSRAQSLGVTPYQVVVIASMIEREAKLPEDRPLIASVIYNRLHKGMKLGICATVEYALGYNKPVLSDKDVEIDSPYNTYRIKGLPPGPICNPGFESIRAALHPASTDYIYYILTGSNGKHSFTADYQQFARWKAELNQKQQ
jgi:UPF0755 protein